MESSVVLPWTWCSPSFGVMDLEVGREVGSRSTIAEGAMMMIVDVLQGCAAGKCRNREDIVYNTVETLTRKTLLISLLDIKS
jgi:hypothetical protein